MTRSVLLPAALLAVSAAGAHAQEGRQARCEITVERQASVSGDCLFVPIGDGSFSVHHPSGIFAYVLMTGKGEAEASWNGNEGAKHAHDDLGVLRRSRSDGACWVNDLARVCAW